MVRVHHRFRKMLCSIEAFFEPSLFCIGSVKTLANRCSNYPGMPKGRVRYQTGGVHWGSMGCSIGLHQSTLSEATREMSGGIANRSRYVSRTQLSFILKLRIYDL